MIKKLLIITLFTFSFFAVEKVAIAAPCLNTEIIYDWSARCSSSCGKGTERGYKFYRYYIKNRDGSCRIVDGTKTLISRDCMGFRCYGTSDSTISSSYIAHTLSINSSTYQPGETIRARGYFALISCHNYQSIPAQTIFTSGDSATMFSAGSYQGSVSFNQSTGTFHPDTDYSYVYSSSANLKAPITSGNYKVWTNWNYISSNIEIPYSVLSPPNQSPTATILHPSYNTTLVQGASLSFSGTGSDSDGSIVAYRWTASAPYGSFVESRASFTRTFANTGVYNICLSVQDDDGAWSTNNPCRTITVNPPPAPTVSLSASPTSLYLGSYTRLSWSVSGADSCTASSTSGGNWSGSKSSSGSNSQYVYPSSTGTKTYTLTCTSGGGSTTRSVNVSVSSPPNVSPTAYIDLPASNKTINEGESVYFSGRGTDSDGYIANYRWNLGGCNSSQISSSSSFTNTFNIPGTYKIYLSVRDDDGVWSTNCPSRTITVVACVCSESSNNYCSGTLYNDSCGNSVCPGSYSCSGGFTCTPPSYSCSADNVWTKESLPQLLNCFGYPASCLTTTGPASLCSDTKTCGTATCRDGYLVTVCHDGNVHEQTRGIKETCSLDPIDPCGEELVDCGPADPTPKEICETGYICKEINSDEAECVPKTATWIEN
jgi:hypothetical protein